MTSMSTRSHRHHNLLQWMEISNFKTIGSEIWNSGTWKLDRSKEEGKGKKFKLNQRTSFLSEIYQFENKREDFVVFGISLENLLIGQLNKVDLGFQRSQDDSLPLAFL